MGGKGEVGWKEGEASTGYDRFSSSMKVSPIAVCCLSISLCQSAESREVSGNFTNTPQAEQQEEEAELNRLVAAPPSSTGLSLLPPRRLFVTLSQGIGRGRRAANFLFSSSA